MIYSDADNILIRSMERGDIQAITDAELAQGRRASTDKYEMRFRHHSDGQSIALVAEYCGRSRAI